jgi:hypothetical protein
VISRYGALFLVSLFALRPLSAEPQATPPPNEPQLDAVLQEAVLATLAGDLARALALYQEAEESGLPAYAWAGISGQVALHRMAGDGHSARALTDRIAQGRPELAGLMAIWDGDTAVLEDDLSGAIASYERALDRFGDQWVDGKPIGAVALRQVSRAHLERGDARSAARAERRLLLNYGGAPNAELAAARILAFEAMATGELPLKPLEQLLHDGDCSAQRPCALGGRRDIGRGRSQAVLLAGIAGMEFTLDAELRGALDRGGALQSAAPLAAATACVTPIASDGFQNPIVNSAYGYRFMSSPDCCSGWHPGVDLNGAGDDCGLDFNAVASGCVRDVMSSSTDWGTAAVEHFYTPGNWTSQYGHGDRVYYSIDQAIVKGAPLGNVDTIGKSSGCHLHFEIREADHTARNDASAYHNSPQGTVADEYQDPEPFIAAHKAYQEARWTDEESFTFYGTWTTVTGAGDQDDLRWAYTTSGLTNYARYEWTPSTSGTHEVWAFVPLSSNRTRRAPVKVVDKSTGAAAMTATVDQSLYKDAWVRIGSALLSSGTPYYVEVASNTAESFLRVTVDDFLILRLDGGGVACTASVPPDRWRGEYFANRSLSGTPVMVRDDGNASLNFDWGSGSPGSSCGLGADSFSARWTRTVSFASGTHRFTVTGDDGVRLYLDGALKLDKWFDQGPTTYTVDVALGAGNHTLTLEYYENAGGAVAKLSWQPLAPVEVIVDDLSAGFARFGPSAYWWQASIGYLSHMYWTYVNGTTVSNYARWTPNLASGGSGNYAVYVFIPRNYATAQQAKYRVHHNGLDHTSAPVNQALYFDQWVSIGTYFFSATGGEYVELTDATGEAYSTLRKLGFDAVKFVK